MASSGAREVNEDDSENNVATSSEARNDDYRYRSHGRNRRRDHYRYRSERHVEQMSDGRFPRYIDCCNSHSGKSIYEVACVFLAVVIAFWLGQSYSSHVHHEYKSEIAVCKQQLQSLEEKRKREQAGCDERLQTALERFREERDQRLQMSKSLRETYQDLKDCDSQGFVGKLVSAFVGSRQRRIL